MYRLSGNVYRVAMIRTLLLKELLCKVWNQLDNFNMSKLMKKSLPDGCRKL